MFLPASADLTMYRNGVYRQRFALTSNSTPIDITGDAIAMHVRANKGDTGPPVIAITDTPTASGSRTQIITPASGIFEIYISNTDLALVPEASVKPNDVSWVYNIIRTEAAGDYYPIFVGSFIVKEGVGA